MTNVECGGRVPPWPHCDTVHAGCTGAALQRQLAVWSGAGGAHHMIALLNLKVQSFEESPQAKFVSLRTITAGAMLGTVMSFEEHPDCAKRKRPAPSRPTEQSPRGSNGANGPSVPR